MTPDDGQTRGVERDILFIKSSRHPHYIVRFVFLFLGQETIDCLEQRVIRKTYTSSRGFWKDYLV